MPATVTKTVKPNGGGDYTSLQAALVAEAAAHPSLVADDIILQFECYSGLDTTPVSVSGFTTDATRYLRIYAATGEGHTGFYNASKYRLEVSGARAFTIGSSVTKHVRLEQMQCFVSGTLSGMDGYFESSNITAPADIRYQNCIAKAAISGATGSGQGFRSSATASDDATIITTRINCIADSFRNADTEDDSFGWNSTAHTNNKEFNYNCLAINCDNGFRDRSNIRYKNCAAVGCTNGWVPTSGPHANSTNNASTMDADARATNPKHKVAVLFVDPLNNDYRLHNSDSGLKGLGVDLSADADFPFSTDIAGATRGAPWCIGPSEADGAATQAVRWCHVGGVTDSAANVLAHLHQSAAVANLRYGTDSTLATYSTATAASTAGNNNVLFALTGLQPDSTYFYVVEIGGTVYSDRIGHFKTHPTSGAFRFAVAGDLDTGIGAPIMRVIDSEDPLFFLLLGDAHYENITSNSPTAFRNAYETAHLIPATFEVYQHRQVEYIWDDHDYAGGDSDGTAPARPAAQDAYRENVAHYPLAAGESGQLPIYHSYVIGRVRFVVSDLRSARSPKSSPDTGGKTMMGTAQKQWFKDELLAAKDAEQLVVWVCSVPWVTSSTDFDDSWQGYQSERRELADFMQANGIANLIRVSADLHMAAIDDGTNDLFTTDGVGNHHVTVQAAPLHQSNTPGGGTYTSGIFAIHAGQYALFTVADAGGADVTVTMSLRWGTTELYKLIKTYTLVQVPPAGDLGSYENLQTLVANYLGRDDLTARIPDFIALAEAAIRRRQEWFTEIYSIRTGEVFTVDAVPMELPNYVREVTAIWAAGGGYYHPIAIVTPEAWRSFVESNKDTAGIPEIAVVTPVMDDWMRLKGARLLLWPRPATAFDIDFEYVRDLPPLSFVGSTALSLRHPDLYLYGTLLESAPYLLHDERIPIWQDRYNRCVREINREREDATSGPALRNVILPVVFG